MLTTNPSQFTTQNQAAAFQSMQQKWLFCPESDLANLFYYNLNNNDERISCYVVDQAKLEFLLSNVDANKDINIRLYMTTDPNIPYGTIKRDTPSFRPIIQIFNTDNIPSDIYTNALLVNGLSDKPVISDTPITILQANQMNTDWNNYLKADLPQIFETQDVRINFTTFDASDSESIRNTFNNDPVADRKLYVYMGYEMPTEADKPFGFRFVLNIVVDSLSVGVTQDFFEFSNPCPPAC